MDPYPIRDLARWWNNLDLGAPPTSVQVIEVSEATVRDENDDPALAVLTTSREWDRKFEPASTALVSAALGINLMELTPPRIDLDGSIDYENWMTSCAEVRDRLRELGADNDAASDSTEPAIPAPFDEIAQLICDRSNDGLPTLLDGPTVASAALAAYSQDESIINNVRFLAYSGSPIAMRVAEHLRIPAVVPFVVTHSDDQIYNLAAETIAAAVNNAENSRLALLEDLNPQTEA